MLKNYYTIIRKNQFQKLVSNCGHLLKLNYVFYNYVAIDLENQKINACLYSMKDRFILGNKAFILSGAIECQIPECDNKDYCSSFGGSWSQKENNEKLRVNLAILFYILPNKILNIN